MWVDSTIDFSPCLTPPLAPVLDWTDKDEHKTFKEDDDVTLVVPFSPQGGQPNLIEWAQGDHPIFGNRFRAINRDGRTELNIRRVRRDDGGRYSVTASNESGYSTAKFELSVESQVPDAPAFIRRLHDIAVKVGTRARLLVEIRSPTEIKIHWYRNDRKLEENKIYRTQHDGNFYFIDLSSVSLFDSGRWTCLAENAVGRSHCSCELSVLVPKAYKAPFFTKELEAILTEQGTVSLECKVMGIPTPQLIWYKDNKKIKAGDIFALTANPKDPSSLGTYTCEAVNCMGAAFSTSRVIARGQQSFLDDDDVPFNSLMPPGPAPIFIKEVENVKAKIGTSAILECQVLVPPWPRSIYWYNKEGVVEASDKYHIMADGLGGYSIEINYLEAVDDGEWKCVATSSSGVKQFSAAYVHVLMPKNYRKPRFVESLKAVMTDDGLVSFECKVVGFPTPTLQWFKDNEELKPGDVYQLTGTSSLGSYCCVAKNVMGKAESSTQLTIEDIRNHLSEEDKLLLLTNNKAPKFIEGLKSCQATVNEEFKFTVQVSISPEPKVSWFRDDQQVVESDNVKILKETLGVCHLKIHALEVADQAEWKCIATNDFGQSITSCFLKLNVPKHYKKPKFLEELKAVLSEGGAVNLECKVIGVPQPTLKWFKDGRELKAGDIHKIISGEDGTCCLGIYTCEAHNCMGTTSSSAALLGFEDKSQIEKAEEGKKALIVKDPSLSTIQEEGTSEIYDTPMASIEEREISFSFDGKEVSVSLYETPDLTEEEAIKVVEMYADELSEHISDKNMIELPPLRFTKESSRSQNIQMEAVVIDVDHKGTTEDDDLRTDAGLDEISEDVMSPKTTFESFDTPVDDIPYDVINSEFLEKTLSDYLEQNKLETIVDVAPPVKPPRKKDNQDRSKSKSSEKSSKSDPNEQFLDALSDERTQGTTKTSFETAKDSTKKKDDKPKPVETSKTEGNGVKNEINNNKDSTATTVTKTSIETTENISRKSLDSNTRDDDSLIEFERQKLANISKGEENAESKDEAKAKISKSKRKQKGSESSEKEEDDSLIEYEKRKSKTTLSPQNKNEKSSPDRKIDSKTSETKNTDNMSRSSSSEDSEKRLAKSQNGLENRKSKSSKSKRKLKSTENHSETRKAMSSPETGISEYNPSDDLEESDMKTSNAEQQPSLPMDLSIETEGDSAIDQTDMTVFDSLKHSLREIEVNLSEVEKQMISNESNETKEMIHTLIQPLKEIEKGLEFIEREVDIEAIRQYPERETRIGSNILEALSQPIQEFEFNLTKIDSGSNQSIALAFAPALQELHREMALLQQQQACFESTEDIVSVANSFSPKLLEVEGGIEQSVSTIKEEVSELSEFTIPNLEKARSCEIKEEESIESLAVSTPKVFLPEDDSSVLSDTKNSILSKSETRKITTTSSSNKGYKAEDKNLDEKSEKNQQSEFLESSKSGVTVDKTLQKLIKYSNKINTCLSRIQEYLHEARTDEEKQTLQDLITFIQPLKDLQSITLNSVSEIMSNEQLNAFENQEVVNKLLSLVEKPIEMLELTVTSIQSICDELNNPCMYVLEIMQSQIESSEDMAGTLEDMTNLEALANHLQELKDRLVIVMKETPLMELNKYPRNDITRNVFETIQKPVENLNNGLMKIENYALEPVVNEWTAREVLKGITKPIEDLLIGISKIKDSFPMSELIKIPTLELVEKLIKPLESVEKGIAALTIKEFPDERFSDEDSYMSEGTTLASISEITNEEASMGYDTVLEPIFQKKSATTADRSKSNSSTGENNIYSPKELQKVLREKTLSPQNSRSDEETCKKGDIVDKLKDQQSSSDNALNGGSLSLTDVTSISYDKPIEINEDMASESEKTLLNLSTQQKEKKNLTSDKLISNVSNVNNEKLNISQQQALTHKAELIDSLIKKENIIKEILLVSEAQKPITVELKSHLAEKAEIIKELLKTETKIDTELNKSLSETQNIVPDDLKSAQSLSQEDKEKLVKEVEVIEKICNRKGMKIETLKQAEAQFAQTHEVEKLIEKAKIIDEILHKDNVAFEELQKLHTRTEDISKVALQGILHEQEQSKDSENMLDKENLNQVSIEDLKAHKLNVNQEQALSHKAELIDSLVKEENIIKEILKISEAQKPITIELKSHLAEKAEIIKELLEAETKIDIELNKSFSETQKIALNDLKSAQSLSQDDKEKLVKEVEVIENICNKKEMKIEALKQAETQFAQTHEVENLVQKARIIEGILQKEKVAFGDLQKLHMTEDIDKEVLQGKLNEQEQSEDNEKMRYKGSLTEVPMGDLKEHKLNYSQKQVLSHKAELIDSLQSEEKIINELLLVSEAQKPITVELKSHLAEKAEIIKELLETETKIDAELNKSFNETQNIVLDDLKSAQSLSQEDKEKLVKEVEVIEKICNKQGMKIETLKQAEAQFAQTHEVENLIEKAKIIDEILHKENVAFEELQKLHTRTEDISKAALQGILHKQDQSKDSENMSDKQNLTQVSIEDLKAHNLNVSQEQALSHKAELIDSLVKEENIIKEILKISEAQKPITVELKSHLAEKAEIIKELLKTETKIDTELNKSLSETQNIVPDDLKSAQSLSQEDKEKLVKEVEVIEKICNNQGIKIETLKQAEAQFAQTHEVENLIEKAGIIVSILHKKDVELADLKIIHAKTEDIGKVALQGTLDEQEPTYEEDLKKVCYAEVPQEELKVLKLNINQKQALSQKAELINALVNEENIVRELLQQSETQNPLTVELKSHLAEKADIIKDLLETETIVDKELSKELKPLQALCPDDKDKLLKEVEVIGNVCNQSGMKIETLKQAEAQFAQTHEIENLMRKAKIIDHMLQTEDVELRDLKTLYAKIEDTGKVALQGKLQEQEESLEEKLKLNVRQEQALSHKVDLIHSLAKEENIIREILQISEAQKPITMELKTHLAEKAEIIKDLLKTEKTLDKELKKNMEEKQNLNDMKSIQALSQDDKEKLLKEVEVIENVCDKKGIKIEALKQAEAQFAQTHEVEILVAKAEIIESILQKESVEPGDLKPHHLTIENIENLMQQVKVIEVLLNVEVGEGELLHVRALQQLTPTQISELSQKKKEIKNVMKLSAEMLSNETEMGKLNSQRNKLAETAELIESLLTLEERNFNQGFLEDDPQYSSEEQKRIMRQKAEIIESLLKTEEIKFDKFKQKVASNLSFNEVNSLAQQAKCIDILLKSEISNEEMEKLKKLQKLTTNQQNILAQKANNLATLYEDYTQKQANEDDQTMIKARMIQSLLDLESQISKEEKIQPILLKQKADVIESLLKYEALDYDSTQLFSIDEIKILGQKAKCLKELTDSRTHRDDSDLTQNKDDININELTEKAKALQDILRREHMYLEILNLNENQKYILQNQIEVLEQQATLLEELANLETLTEASSKPLSEENRNVLNKKGTIVQEILKKEVLKNMINAKDESLKVESIVDNNPKTKTNNKQDVKISESNINKENKESKNENGMKEGTCKSTTDEKEAISQKANEYKDKKLKDQEELKKNKVDEKNVNVESTKNEKEEIEKTQLEAEKDKARLETEKKKKEEEVKAKLEAEQKKKEEEEKAKLEAEKKKKEEEEKAKLEAEKKKKEEEEKAKLKAEKKKKEEAEKKKKEEEEKKKKEEEEKAKLEAEKKKKEEEEKKKKEEEEKKKKEEEEKAKLEAEKKKKEEEEKKKKEEEEKAKLEAGKKKKEEEEKAKLEAEKKKKEEEEKAKLEAEKKKKEEEEKTKLEAERKKKEEEEKAKLEAERKKKEEEEKAKLEAEKKKKEEEEKAKLEAEKKKEEEEEKAKLEAEKKKKEEEEKAKLEAEKKKKDEEEKAKLEAEKKKKEEEEKTKLEAEKKKKEEEEKAKLEAEKKKKEEEEKAKLEAEKKKKEEEEKKKKEEEEKAKLEAEKKKKEEEEKAKLEAEKKKKEEEEKARLEAEKKKKEEEEKAKLEAEKKKKEEEEKAKLEAEKKTKEEEEKAKLEAEKKKKEEEEKAKLEAEKKKKEEEEKAKLEAEKKKKEEEEKAKLEAEKKKKEEEEKAKLEAEKKKKEEEEKAKLEAEKKKKDEEEKAKLEAEKKKKEEEEKAKLEAEKKKKEEEEKAKLEAEKKKKDEEEKAKLEAEKKKKEEEEKAKLEAEKKKKEEEEKAKLEAEKKKKDEEEKAKLEAEKKKKEEEEKAKLEAEKKNKEKEEKAKLEAKKKEEEEKKKKEEEEKAKLEAEKKKKEEEEKAKLEAEKKKKEEEEKAKLEAEKKKKEEEEKKKKEEEEKAKLEAEKKKKEEEEKAMLEAEKKKKEEEEKAKLEEEKKKKEEEEKKKKEEEEKAKLEAEKKKKEEEEKAMLEAEKKKKEEEEKAKLEAEKKKKEEEEKAKLEAKKKEEEEKEKKEEEEKAKLEAEKKKKKEEEKAKLEAEKKKKEEEEKAKLEAEKKKKEEEEKAKLEAKKKEEEEKEKKEEEEKAKLEAEKKKKKEEEKAKLEAEKKKKEEEEKAKLEAEKKKKEEEEKAKLEAEKKKKEEEEKAKLEAEKKKKEEEEKKKKEEEEKAKLEAEKKKKEEEEKAKLEAEKKKKEEEEKAKLEAEKKKKEEEEKKKKEEEEKAKLEPEKKKKEEEEKAKLEAEKKKKEEAEKKKKEEEEKAKLEAEKKKKEEEEKAKLEAEKKRKDEEEKRKKEEEGKANLEAEKKKKEEEEKAKLGAEKKKKEEEKAKLEAEKKRKDEEEKRKKEQEEKKKKEEEEKAKLEAEKKKKEEEEKARLEADKKKKAGEKAKSRTERKEEKKNDEDTKRTFENGKKENEDHVKLESTNKEKSQLKGIKKDERTIDDAKVQNGEPTKGRAERRKSVKNEDDVEIIWKSSVETSERHGKVSLPETIESVDKTRLVDVEGKSLANEEKVQDKKKHSQFLPDSFKLHNGHSNDDTSELPHPYMHEFSKDVMARKRIIQEVNGTSGDLGGDTSKTAVGDVEKAFYTNESALLDSKPKFSQRLFDKSGTQGTTLCLSCSILYTKDSVKYAPYYAPELIEWYKDGQNILTFSDVRRYRAFFCDNIATLEIKDCKLDDSGQYTCLARNKYGRSSTSCNVKVYANFEPAPMGPVFSRLIKENYKFLDDELTLECRVKCFPPAKITWLKDNVPIRPINRYYQTELSDGVCRLTICSPDGDIDNGKYTCRAEHDVWTEHTYYFLNFQGRDYHTMGKVGRRSQSSGSLAVVQKHLWHPQKPSILRGYVKPEVIWLRGNTPLPKSSPRFKYIEDSNNLHTLILSGVTAEEAGKYTCRVSNEYGYTETFARVDVINVSSGAVKHEKPAMFLTRPDTMMSVALGEDISFSFRLAGSPKPKVTWMKGIKDITTSSRTMTETVNDYVRLTLKRATDDENGTYFIVARNIYGSDRAFVTVRIRQRARSMNALTFYKPEISSIYQGVHENFKEQFNKKDVPEQISEAPIVSASGRNWLTLTWLKPQSDVLAPVLAYKVEAWKMGADGGGFWNELGISATHSFDAFNLTPGCQYRFRVTPRNRYGWGESTMTTAPVTIGEHMGLPEFAEDLPGQLKVLVGSDVTLDGVVHSSTTPDLRWLKDGTILQIDESDRLETHFDEGKVSLTIHNIQLEDSGRYICEAINKVGRVSSYSRLMVVTDPKLIEADHGLRKITQEACPIVNTAPQFTMRLRDRRVQVSYPVRLTCQIVAFPVATVTWAKDDAQILPDDRHDFITDGNFYTLEISHTELDDSGEYSVTASNSVGGSVTCKASLIVDKGIRGYIAPEFTIELPSSITIREHEDLKFSAHVEAYPCVGITWHRNGVKLRPTRRQVMTLDHDGNVDFTLVHASRKEEGVYTCTASNEIGKVESHCTVTVERESNGRRTSQTANIPKLNASNLPYSKEPQFITKPRSTECVEGDTVEILCEVIGDPMPKVTWTRDWLKIGIQDSHHENILCDVITHDNMGP
ncbi:hypothetical protein M8J76_007197 [Diaphorina citri]|nr:hypothetical protein M8J76_007197 [Diaphorina citri]